MTAQNVMLTKPVTVPDTASLEQAIDALFSHGVKTVPVVDASGRYRGLFGMHSLVHHLLPRAAKLDGGASLTDLTFVHDTLDAVRERLASNLNEPVLQFVDRDAAQVAPAESLLGTLLRLHRHGHTLPVVDPDSGKLLGIVTYWAIIAKLTGRPV